MSDTQDLAILAGLGIVAYLIVRKDVTDLFKTKPWTQQQTVTALNSAGVKTNTTVTGTYVPTAGGVARVTEDWNPNPAQRILIGLDAVVPGDWLTRRVLGL